MKILILKPSSLGDVIQALPVLRLLKRHQPQNQIYWWISSELADLLRGDPDLEDIVVFERKRWSSPLNWLELVQSLRLMRRLEFDLILDLQSLMRSAAFGWFANGRRFIGLEDRREGAPALHDTSLPRPSYHTHAVDWYLEVLRYLKIPVDWNFEWLPRRADVVRDIPAKLFHSDQKVMALQPGARWDNKRWPVEHFRQLVKQIGQADASRHFIILGGNGDRPLGDAISEALPDRCLNLAGRTTLPEMVEWLRRSELLVTNDTGPMHVAAALGKPVVGLFGPTTPARTGPYGQYDRILQRTELPCVPCMSSRCRYENYMECLWKITPEEVVHRIHDLQPFSH